MVEIPYIEYDTEDMILRDFLALHRSQLANERTFLAYIRTALTLSGGGITLAKLFEGQLIRTIGWILVPIGILVALAGIYRYISVRYHFRDLDDSKSQVQYEETDNFSTESESFESSSTQQQV